MIRKGDWKLIETCDPKEVELYHLSDELSESRNLADQEPENVDQLHRELEAWRSAVAAECMRPNPDYEARLPR